MQNVSVLICVCVQTRTWCAMCATIPRLTDMSPWNSVQRWATGFEICVLSCGVCVKKCYPIGSAMYWSLKDLSEGQSQQQAVISGQYGDADLSMSEFITADK